MPFLTREFMHGAVLAKICRSDQPVSLTLIQTSHEDRSAYRLNDTCVLYMKWAKISHPSRKGKLRWQFTFNPPNIRELADLIARDAQVHMVLICSKSNLKETEACLLYPDEVKRCLDLSQFRQQTLSVEVERYSSVMRAYGRNNSDDQDKVKVDMDRLDKWEIPGR